jgi:hypothetical protein
MELRSLAEVMDTRLASTNMQSGQACNRVSINFGPLDGDPTTDGNFAINPSHHLALICIEPPSALLPVEKPAPEVFLGKNPSRVGCPTPERRPTRMSTARGRPILIETAATSHQMNGFR